MKKKECKLCQVKKSFDEFYKQKAAKDKYNPYCKDCALIKSKEYINRNRIKEDKVRFDNKCCYKCNQVKTITSFSRDKTKCDGFSTTCKECNRAISKDFRNNNPNYCSEYNKQYYKENKEELRLIAKIKAPLYREKVNQWMRNYLKNNLNYKITCRLRNRIRDCMKKTNNRKISKATILLGCSIEEFKLYLEKQFTVGMTWDNYGKNGWELDHIKPCAAFDFSKIDEQQKCFHYTNLQPLWKSQNAAKNSNYNNQRYSHVKS